MRTTDPSKYSCGTSAVGWMDGAHPTSVGEIVSRKICFSSKRSGKCEWSNANTKVAGCRGSDGQLFYLYQLKKAPVCELAYCAI